MGLECTAPECWSKYMAIIVQVIIAKEYPTAIYFLHHMSTLFMQHQFLIIFSFVFVQSKVSNFLQNNDKLRTLLLHCASFDGSASKVSHQDKRPEFEKTQSLTRAVNNKKIHFARKHLKICERSRCTCMSVGKPSMNFYICVIKQTIEVVW